MSIYALRPVNKTAALVTNQSGCNQQETEYVKLLRERRDILDSIESIKKNRAAAETKKEKKEMGCWILDLQGSLISRNERIKQLKMANRETMNSLLIVECMKRFSEKEWEEINSIARQRLERVNR